MTEYIKREDVIEAIASGDQTNGWENIFCGRALIGMITKIPSADVRPVVHGKWIDEPIKGIRYHCSVCQGRFDYTWRYCPNCGSDMRQEEES